MFKKIENVSHLYMSLKAGKGKHQVPEESVA
jgi:hypothetical protein